MTEPDAGSSPTRPAAAAALAFIAFPLALLCLMGYGVLDGRTYVLPIRDSLQDVWEKGFVVASLVLSAVIALAPLRVASAGHARLHPDDVWWIHPLLRSARVLAWVAVGSHLFVAGLVAISGDINTSMLF